MDSIERKSLPAMQVASAHAATPRGCKGAACPAFAICQGRCAVRRTLREIERQMPVAQ